MDGCKWTIKKFWTSLELNYFIGLPPGWSKTETCSQLENGNYCKLTATTTTTTATTTAKSSLPTSVFDCYYILVFHKLYSVFFSKAFFLSSSSCYRNNNKNVLFFLVIGSNHKYLLQYLVIKLLLNVIFPTLFLTGKIDFVVKLGSFLYKFVFVFENKGNSTFPLQKFNFLLLFFFKEYYWLCFRHAKTNGKEVNSNIEWTTKYRKFLKKTNLKVTFGTEY